MATIRFGMIGAGWRSQFFIRIAQAFPERFACEGVVVRDANKREAYQRAWAVATYASLEALVADKDLDFVVVSTRENHQVILEVVRLGLPCLSETPPARNLDELLWLYEAVQGNKGRVQIAEQYHLRPHHQAQMQVLTSGKLGTVRQAQCAIAHGYHGVSIMRRFLGIGFDNARISATSVSAPLIQGPDRSGPPNKETIIEERQILAWFHFENQTFGSLDFSSKHYRSWIRQERLLLRGERGEISGLEVRYLQDYVSPMAFRLERVTQGQEGDLSLPFFQGYRGEGLWLYRNPFGPSLMHDILMDDEIAVAHCLEKMATYVHTGQDFYSLAEASQDVYLALLYEQAAKDARVVESETQVWAKA